MNNKYINSYFFVVSLGPSPSISILYFRCYVLFILYKCYAQRRKKQREKRWQLEGGRGGGGPNETTGKFFLAFSNTILPMDFPNIWRNSILFDFRRGMYSTTAWECCRLSTVVSLNNYRILKILFFLSRKETGQTRHIHDARCTVLYIVESRVYPGPMPSVKEGDVPGPIARCQVSSLGLLCL